MLCICTLYNMTFLLSFYFLYFLLIYFFYTLYIYEIAKRKSCCLFEVGLNCMSLYMTYQLAKQVHVQAQPLVFSQAAYFMINLPVSHFRLLFEFASYVPNCFFIFPFCSLGHAHKSLLHLRNRLSESGLYLSFLFFVQTPSNQLQSDSLPLLSKTFKRYVIILFSLCPSLIYQLLFHVILLSNERGYTVMIFTLASFFLR
jgi:hypothetical protein